MSGEHAVFSPSSAKRWMTCPGSVALSVGVPDESSPYADEGTKAHKLFEALLTGETFMVSEYPPDMLRHVANAVEDARELIPDGSEYFVEEKLKHSELIYGTADLVVPEHFGTLTVADLKYGQGVPVAVRELDGSLNPQLLIYASMASAKYDDCFSQVRMVILQPRVDAEVEVDVTIPVETVIAFRDEMEKAVAAAKEPNAPLVPSKEGCRFCPAKVKCPALAEAASLVDTSQNIPSLSPEKVADILAKRDQVEGWFSAVYAYGVKLAEAGVEIPGFTLKPKRAYARWKPGAENAAEKLYGQKLFVTELLSPAQARKILKKESDQEFLDEWIDSKSSGMNLVKAPEVNLMF